MVGISLLSSCVLRFRRKDGARWERASIVAEPRSAYLLRDPARTDWEHSIPAVAESEELFQKHQGGRPGFLRKLFMPNSLSRWQETLTLLAENSAEANLCYEQAVITYREAEHDSASILAQANEGRDKHAKTQVENTPNRSSVLCFCRSTN